MVEFAKISIKYENFQLESNTTREDPIRVVISFIHIAKEDQESQIGSSPFGFGDS